MRPTTPFAALLAALLLLPLPVLAAGSDPVTIHVPHLRAGDRLLVVESYTAPDDPALRGEGEPAEATTILLVEGPGVATDRYGIARAVSTYRVDLRYGDESYASERCHQIQGGRDVVRIELLGASPAGIGWSTSDDFLGLWKGGRRESESVPIVRYEGSCHASNALGGRTLREGDRVAFGDVVPEADPAVRDVLSRPATAATAHGRNALVVSFDPALVAPHESSHVASVEATLADGLPGALSVKMVAQGRYQGAARTIELRGIERGEGPELSPDVGAKLPARHPAARFVAPPPRHLDDAAFGLAFPYAEAYHALLDDPRAGFQAWLDAHPSAHLAQAHYLKGGRPAEGVSARTEGSWWLIFRDGPRAYHATIDRLSGFETPAGPVASPVKAHQVSASTEEDAQAPPSAALAEVADSRSLARAVEGAGIRMRDVVSVGYYAFTDYGGRPGAVLAFSTTDMQGQQDAEGNEVTVDPVSGGLVGVYATTVRTTQGEGILAPAPGASIQPARASALSVLAGPGVGAGLAVGGAAATGLALLLVLLKFVAVPLFTRLRRDRLLDNPVRARLYERIRQEPGIHLAELVDFAGLGKGATRHHVDQLVRHRLVVETQDEGFVRYFAAGEVPPDVARREMVLRAGATREVYDLLAAEPGLSLREAAARLGMAAPTVHRYRKRLEKAGLLPAPAAAEVRASEA